MYLRSVNPYNDKLLKEYQEQTYEEIHTSINVAHEQFLKWKTTTYNHRSTLMHNCADELLANKKELGLLITREMGKVISESIAEIEKCATVCRYYADHAERFLMNEPLETESGEAYIQYCPLGVVLAVMPWNFPFWQVFRFAAPALMAGNTALLKHASNVPQCAMAIEELFKNAGFPDGCFTTLMIKTNKVNFIIDHPYVVATTLTGSEDAGSAVAAESGKNLKKSVLELGGTDPFIVLKDADIDNAVKNGVKSRMINFGQSCIAAKRFIVEEQIYDEFLKAFKHQLDQLKSGDPENPSTNISVLARKDLAQDLFYQVKKSLELGATLEYGQLPLNINSAYFPPLILSNAKPGMPCFNEELFGPVAVFYKVKDKNEAIAVANESEFGLGGSVWTEDINKGIEVAEKIESGAVYVNKMMASDASVPFGGIKKSGYGRELSHLGIREFVNQKTIWVG